jgi:hypothetical protein
LSTKESAARYRQASDTVQQGKGLTLPAKGKVFMTPEDRIEALEQEVEKLRADLAALVQVVSCEGGVQTVFQHAVVALITATPPNPLLEELLSENLARTEAQSVAGAEIDAYVEGVQEAQDYVLSGLEESRRLYAK